MRFYKQETLTQEDARRAPASEIAELDAGLKLGMEKSAQSNPVLCNVNWRGTQRVDIGGFATFVSSYERNPKTGLVKVQLYRVFNGARSFTLTISYDADAEAVSKPIVHRLAKSFRVTP